MTALQIVSIILGILGFGGMVSGLVIRAVGKRSTERKRAGKNVKTRGSRKPC